MRSWGRRNARLYAFWARLLALGGYRRMIRGAIRGLPIGGRVADVGCGDGEALALLARERPDLRPFACDLSPEFLTRARRRHPRPALFAADIEMLAARTACFDAVLCFGVLGHLLIPGPALDEVVRITRKGGRVALWTRTDGWFSRRVARAFERKNPGVAFVLHPPAEVRRGLEARGVNVQLEARVAGGFLWMGERDCAAAGAEVARPGRTPAGE